MSIKYEFAAGKYQSDFSSALTQLSGENFLARLWEKDGSLWSDEPAHRAVALNRLGWLNLPSRMIREASVLEDYASAESYRKFTHIVHLGMGGSSLAPEVLFRSIASAEGYPELTVLDSTDPDQIESVLQKIKLESSLFIVASKSGTTIETHSLAKFFYETMLNRYPENIASHFIAITDPGTALQTAGEAKYARVFLNPPDIGGRYSALSYFGLVPFALIGGDLTRFLRKSVEEENACGPTMPTPDCSAVQLGAFLGALCSAGANKLTIETSPTISTVGWWIEQLVAESTGKNGKGILPVTGEEMTVPSFYSSDRVFVHMKIRGDVELEKEEKLRILSQNGFPVVSIQLDEVFDLSGLMYQWEVATAAASAIIRVDPFDEPNVTESKDNTKMLLHQFESKGSIQFDEVPLISGPEKIYGNVERSGNVYSVLNSLFGRNKAGEYLAIMAYLPRVDEVDELLERLRVLLRNRLRIPATVGYGPRFLHSTGQFHKGGTPNGLFLQFVHSPAATYKIPGEDYDFATLIRAQAAGDYLALKRKGKPVVSIHLSDYLADLKKIIAGIV
ncbi:MAG TPA: glucose-6-phosphate isomerase [Candidatus Kryptonia bacterium]